MDVGAGLEIERGVVTEVIAVAGVIEGRLVELGEGDGTVLADAARDNVAERRIVRGVEV